MLPSAAAVPSDDHHNFYNYHNYPDDNHINDTRSTGDGSVPDADRAAGHLHTAL